MVKEQLERSRRDGLEEKREEAVQPKGLISRSLYHTFNLKDTPGILILVKMAKKCLILNNVSYLVIRISIYKLLQSNIILSGH